jgi:hypothetical protein
MGRRAGLVALTASMLLTAAPAGAERPDAPALGFARACYSEIEALGYAGSGFSALGDVTLYFSRRRKLASIPLQADAEGRIRGRVSAPDPAEFLAARERTGVIRVAATDQRRASDGPRRSTAVTRVRVARFEVYDSIPGRFSPPPRAWVTYRASGFTQAIGRRLHLHVVRGGRRLRSVPLGRIAGSCGEMRPRRVRQLPLRRARPGAYRLVFNASRTDHRAQPSVTRRYTAPGGALQGPVRGGGF